MSICVLTGDIVGSTDLSRAKQDRVFVVLDYALRSLTVATQGTLDIYRGDGWQMDFDGAGIGLRNALYVRACLKADSEDFETRVSIAEGTENYGLSGRNSETYVASGRDLDDMPRDVLMGHASGGADHAATLLADLISRDWTLPQARAIEPFLKPNSNVTQKQVAADLGISRQAVGQALDAAGYHIIDRALRAIEEQAK